jgi:hypothetical protein
MAALAALAEYPRIRTGTIPIGAKIKARNLYLIQCIRPTEIAPLVGLTLQQVNGMIVREGWSKIKRKREAQIKANIDPRSEAQLDAVSEAIGLECDQHSLKACERIGESLERTDPNAARDFQALSVGLKNVVAVARTVRGLDTAQAAAPSVNIAFFMGQLQPAEPTNVTPAIELRP